MEAVWRLNRNGAMPVQSQQSSHRNRMVLGRGSILRLPVDSEVTIRGLYNCHKSLQSLYDSLLA